MINACIIATKSNFWSVESVELFLELLLMLLVLVSHDVQNGISYDFDFVRWPLHFEFPSYTSEMDMHICDTLCNFYLPPPPPPTHTHKQKKHISSACLAISPA